MASLAEGIALQGVDTAAQTLGQTAFQLGAQKRQKEDQLDVDLRKLSKGFSNFHRLVQGKAEDLYMKSMGEILDRKTSGDPYWTNEAQAIIMNLDAELSGMKTLSDNYKIFDKQVSKIDPNKTFLAPDLQKFLQEDYRTAGNYEDLLNNIQNKGYDFGGSLGFDPNGNIIYNPETKVNYVRELTKMASQINPIVVDKIEEKGPDGKPMFREINRIPYTEAEVDKFVENNPQFAVTRPKSIESVAADYFLSNPSAAKQFAILNNIPIEYENVNGQRMLSQKTTNAIIEGYKNIARGEAYQKNPLIRGSRDININTNKPEEEPDLRGIFKKQEFDYQSAGKNLVAGSYNVSSSANISLDAGPMVTDKNGNPITMTAENMKVVRVMLQPYKMVNKYPVIAKANDKGIVGIQPFVQFRDQGGSVDLFSALDYQAATRDNLDLTSKSENARYDAIIKRWNEVSDVVTKKIAKGEIKNDSESIIKYIEENYGNI